MRVRIFTSLLCWALIAPLELVAAEEANTLQAPYDRPFIDQDEWRDSPVRHRYVHGGFEDTELRFSMYFPEKAQYEGRFFQPLQAVSGNENIASMALAPVFTIDFAVDSGGYYIESNQGTTDMFGGSSDANAAVAIYSRELAADMYGEHRPYGYVYGGSGGAFKTFGCVENHPGVWDGSVPFVHGSPIAIPHVFTVQAHALRVLRNKFPQIVDALEPGGSGDMYAGLNAEEREALEEVTRMGFPPRAWFNAEKIAFGYTGVFSTLIDTIRLGDPEYFEAFWSEPGYLGADPPESLQRARIQHPTTISALITPDQARERGIPLTMPTSQTESGVDFPAALRIENLPEGSLQGADIIMDSGAAKGTVFSIAGTMGDIVMIGFGAASFEAMAKIRAGDRITIDNSVYLAAQTYHRHQVQDAEFYVWDYFLDKDGKPRYPQRPRLLNAGESGGSSMSGDFHGKMIVMEALMDEAAYPWQADWYRNRVSAAQGDALDDRYRLYYIDNTMHTTQFAQPGDPRPVVTTRIVSYQGALQQSLRHLVNWVERGVEPPVGTRYEVTGGQVRVPAAASARLGIQASVDLSVDGGDSVVVRPGAEVTFKGLVEVPPGAGAVSKAEWDFEGAGDYPRSATLPQGPRQDNPLTVATTYTFDKPGTYFPALRVATHVDGQADAPFGHVQNIDRVRVVVR